MIVRKKYQNQGFSKQILNYAKLNLKSTTLIKLIIPIRPTKKHEFPQVSMSSYIELKNKGEIFDPWITTHINNGARIIKVCSESMTMKGDIRFWESILNKKINKSGLYKLDGALSLINIDIEKKGHC